MSRKRKHYQADGPESPAWEGRRPDDPLYWKYGGPVVPVDEIAAREPSYELLDHMKGQNRLTRAISSLDHHEKEVARLVEWYGRMHEKGRETLQPWDQESYDRIMQSPSQWGNVATPLDEKKAIAFAQIGHHRGMVAKLNRLIAELEAVQNPLFRPR